MRTKLLIALILLAGLLFLINLLVGNYLASVLDRQLQEVSQDFDDFAYHYADLSVNPAFGSLSVNAFTLGGEQAVLEAGEIRGSLTYADIWRIIRNRREDPLSQIHSFRLNLNDLHIWNPGSGVTVQTANLIYNGRLDEFLKVLEQEHLPEYNHRLSLNLNTITLDDEFRTKLNTLPVVSGYQLPGHFSRINMQIRYMCNENRATLSGVRFVSPELFIRASGNIRYQDQGLITQPDRWNLDYELQATTHELARLPLTDYAGGFSMDTLSVKSSVVFEPDDHYRHPLALPGETTLYLGDIHWYPSEQLTEQYGMLFGMFGLSDQRLPVRSFMAEWQNTTDTLRIHDALINTEPFDAQIKATVATPAGQRPDITEGSVRFVRTSADFSDFTDGVERLFRLELPRKEGRLHFEFSGDPRSPDVNIELPE